MYYLLIIAEILYAKKYPDTQCLKIGKKSRIQHCERSELRFDLDWTKVN